MAGAECSKYVIIICSSRPRSRRILGAWHPLPKIRGTIYPYNGEPNGKVYRV